MKRNLHFLQDRCMMNNASKTDGPDFQKRNLDRRVLSCACVYRRRGASRSGKGRPLWDPIPAGGGGDGGRQDRKRLLFQR